MYGINQHMHGAVCRARPCNHVGNTRVTIAMIPPLSLMRRYGWSKAMSPYRTFCQPVPLTSTTSHEKQVKTHSIQLRFTPSGINLPAFHILCGGLPTLRQDHGASRFVKSQCQLYRFLRGGTIVHLTLQGPHIQRHTGCKMAMTSTVI